MSKNYYLLSLLILLISGYVQAQDTHFSNFLQSPVTSNPSLIASSSEMKASAGNRRQWTNIAAPFISYNVNASYPILNRSNVRRGAIGLAFINSKSGPAGAFKFMEFSALFAYNIKVSSTTHIALALKTGYKNKSYSLSTLRTGSQWSGTDIDPNVANGEEKGTISIWRPEIGGSVLWYRTLYGRLNHFLGLSVFNINRPKDAELVGGDRMPLRISAVAGIQLWENDNFIISPKIQYLLQSKSQNLLTGLNVDYKINTEKGFIKNGLAGLGLFYRTEDAVVVTAQISQPKYVLGFAFDYNVSGLSANNKPATSNELFFTYKIPVKRKPKPKTEPVIQDLPPVVEEEKASFVQVKVFNMVDSSAVNATFNLIEIDKRTGKVMDSIELANKLHALKLILPQNKNFEVLVINPGFFPHTEKIVTDKDSIFIDAKLNPIHDGDLLVFENITFQTKEATIDSSSYVDLDEIYKILKLNPGIKIEIAGHTDDIGSKRNNQRLSQQRADAIAHYLLSRGIAADRLVTVGYGEEHPLVKEKSDLARQKNRRVEIKILQH